MKTSPLDDTFFTFGSVRGVNGSFTLLRYVPLQISVTEEGALSASRRSRFALQIAHEIIINPESRDKVIKQLSSVDDGLVFFMDSTAKNAIERIGDLAVRRNPDCVIFLLAHELAEGTPVIEYLRRLPWVWSHPKLMGALEHTIRSQTKRP